ncbi:MAG: adenosylmethionine--8-amino-7-oxononanoate transaminase [Betaproteobacteria bacterium RIFCSPLOWO2_02_FULL_65_24]|nr:MAG: adenosylmethionine--8-amino-7-oxononanoate transaminase [Betaproteobacteria bacterium RIFCSPLOWO2_02_FULL_65_24]OGA96404.1 MAG: adenosylmethionine--8-amino-7-oxononanoate transaminase [Betaproteobacteria bacterium RIFCSPLOWO2_12_FULL_66_14]
MTLARNKKPPGAAGAAASWVERSLATVWHPCTQMQWHPELPMLPIARAEGPWLVGHDGARYFDAISSWWVCLLGHRHPAVVQALREQLDTLDHVMLAGLTHAPAVELSEKLAEKTGRVLGHAFYGSDGSSAVEMALKMSAHAAQHRGFPDKNRFVCLAHGYHGETLGALGVTDLAGFRAPYERLIRGALVAPNADARQALAGETARDVALREARRLEALLSEHGERIAAVITEPLVQCAGGMIFHDAEYLRQVRALCERYAVAWIADEIAVGCGRTGTFFACERAGVWPDLLCLSKGLSGGMLPLSVVLCRDELYRLFLGDSASRAFLHSHSFSGNPLACRAALATLDVLEKDDVLAGNRARAERLTTRLAPVARHERVRHFRQLGMIWAWDVEGAPQDFSQRVFRIALRHELLLRPLGCTVYLMPPFLLGPDEIDALGGRVVAAMHEALA